MELNALTRWESIGKELYSAGSVGRDIRRLKARSKEIDAQRLDAQRERHAVENTLTIDSNGSTPSASYKELSELEREEREILHRFRSLRAAGKKVQIGEDLLERQAVVPSRDVFPQGHQRWVYFSYRIVRRFFKGFAFGFIGKFTFAFIGLCLRHKFKPSILPDILKLLVKPDAYRYGAFLGSFLCIFESCIRLLRMKGWIGKSTLTRHHRSVRVILSASIAGTAAISFLPRDVRLGISMFFCVRALEILVRWMVEEQEKSYNTLQADPEIEKPHSHSGVVAASEKDEVRTESESNLSQLDGEKSPHVLEQVRLWMKSLVVRISKIPASNHFDTAVMALASCEVIWAWLFNRSTVEPSYLHFLDIHGGRTRCVQFGYVDLHRAEHTMDPRWLGQINAIRISEGGTPVDLNMPTPQLMCNVLHHETDSCTLAIWDFWKKSILRSVPVYLPVYLIPMLLFKHRQLLKTPLAVLLPTFSNLARSSLFLSSYCTVCWAVACATTQLGLTNSLKGALAGFSGGLTVAIEKKGRRVELALYVLSQTIPSTWRTLNQYGLVPFVPHGESMVFIASMAVIMWSYVTRPHLMRSSYLSLFKFFFGSGGRSAGFSARAVEHSTPKEKQFRTVLDAAAPALIVSAAADVGAGGVGERVGAEIDASDYATAAGLAAAGGAMVAAGAVPQLPPHQFGRRELRPRQLSTVEDVESEHSDGTTSTASSRKPN